MPWVIESPRKQSRFVIGRSLANICGATSMSYDALNPALLSCPARFLPLAKNVVRNGALVAGIVGPAAWAETAQVNTRSSPSGRSSMTGSLQNFSPGCTVLVVFPPKVTGTSVPGTAPPCPVPPSPANAASICQTGPGVLGLGEPTPNVLSCALLIQNTQLAGPGARDRTNVR